MTLDMLKKGSSENFLLKQIIKRNFTTKYKDSVLGIFWSFLNPLLMMIVQYVVFSNFFFRGGGMEHYAIYLLERYLTDGIF